MLTELEEAVDVALKAIDAPPSRAETWRAFDRAARREESVYERAALALFAKERDSVIARIAAAVPSFKADGDPHPSIANPFIEAALLLIAADYALGGRYHRAWLDRYRALIAQTFRVGGREIASQIGLSFTLDNPRARQAIQQRVTKLTGSVTETTVQRVRDVVSEAMREGVGVTEITRRVRDDAFSDEVTTSRARTIARTETVGALNEARFTAATERGVMQSKRWLSQDDGRVRDSHAFADSEGWISIDGTFSNGLRFPHDPGAPADEVINCRCTLTYSDLSPAEANARRP